MAKSSAQDTSLSSRLPAKVGGRVSRGVDGFDANGATGAGVGGGIGKEEPQTAI